jgi:hypothetical protein
MIPRMGGNGACGEFLGQQAAIFTLPAAASSVLFEKQDDELSRRHSTQACVRCRTDSPEHLRYGSTALRRALHRGLEGTSWPKSDC